MTERPHALFEEKSKIYLLNDKDLLEIYWRQLQGKNNALVCRPWTFQSILVSINGPPKTGEHRSRISILIQWWIILPWITMPIINGLQAFSLLGPIL